MNIVWCCCWFFFVDWRQAFLYNTETSSGWVRSTFQLLCLIILVVSCFFLPPPLLPCFLLTILKCLIYNTTPRGSHMSILTLPPSLPEVCKLTPIPTYRPILPKWSLKPHPSHVRPDLRQDQERKAGGGIQHHVVSSVGGIFFFPIEVWHGMGPAWGCTFLSCPRVSEGQQGENKLNENAWWGWWHDELLGPRGRISVGAEFRKKPNVWI